ncbi:MAG: spore coat associated protein CotJA [Bacillota bacterium]|jgi:hypothetical protein
MNSKRFYENRESDPCPLRIAYATVPLQKVKNIYDYETAFKNGTLFPELNIPLGKYGPNEIK